MTAFEHKGIKIDLTDTGTFIATINATKVRKPSLDAMKAHIDKSLAKPFTAFTGLRRPGYGDAQEHRKKDLMRVKIVAVREDKRARFYDRYQMVEESEKCSSTVFADTPENERLYSQIMAFDNQTASLEKARREERQRLWEGLKIIDAKSFFVGSDAS